MNSKMLGSTILLAVLQGCEILSVIVRKANRLSGVSETDTEKDKRT
jgi:hypothetical protein